MARPYVKRTKKLNCLKTMTMMQRPPLLAFVLLLVIIARGSAQHPGNSAKPAKATGVVVRVAAVSFVPKKFDLKGNADRLQRAFERAKKGGAKIAVAPEGALEGYVVNEIIAGKVPAKRMKEVAIAIDHPIIRRFQRLARKWKMCLVFGFAERIKDDVFNCAVFIDHDGKICGKYTRCNWPRVTTTPGGLTGLAVTAARSIRPTDDAAC